ncbi:hypothetical protein SAMN05444266_10473 [Chitinophaga jiangningensis]|uniref:Uncharacterized protein n=1 Tax=Chitinophaga jiangningensis TaxID=1419482 RepID=A0A1M7BUI6_9BACT|nr:hypothetical protein SAMN05444266_10473 [Chitinophaga jiangningensis]
MSKSTFFEKSFLLMMARAIHIYITRENKKRYLSKINFFEKS